MQSNRDKLAHLIPNPETINVLSHLPCDERAIVEKLPLGEFLADTGMEGWVEGTIIPEAYSNINQEEDTLKQISDLQLILSCIRDEALAVAYMNHQVGFGLFAKKTLPPFTIISVLGGKLTPSAKPNSEVPINPNHHLFVVNQNYYISAKKVGNLGRFIQHAPSSLEECELKEPAIASSVQLANVENVGLHFQDNTYLRCVRTTRKIKKGEIIVMDYGVNHWKRILASQPNIQLVLFDKYGHNLYTEPAKSYVERNNGMNSAKILKELTKLEWKWSEKYNCVMVGKDENQLDKVFADLKKASLDIKRYNKSAKDMLCIFNPKQAVLEKIAAQKNPCKNTRKVS